MSTEKISTDVAYKTFENGMAKTSAEQLLAWSRNMELKRDQFISITMNENVIEEGNNQTTIFYRVKSDSESAIPFDQLQFHSFDTTKPWGALAVAGEAHANNGNTQVVSMTHTPKNIGGLNNQILWFSSEGLNKYDFTNLTDSSGNWSALIKKTREYMNKFIAPHQLVHVSFYESTHPNDGDANGDKTIYAQIIHTAGPNPVELRLIENSNLPATGIYAMSVLQGQGEFREYFDDAVKIMNGKGGEEGHLVASTNNSSDDGAIVVVFSW